MYKCNFYILSHTIDPRPIADNQSGKIIDERTYQYNITTVSVVAIVY